MQSKKVVEKMLGKKLSKDKFSMNKYKNSLDLTKYNTKFDAIYHLNVDWGLDYDEVLNYVNDNWDKE
jgi:hypothetical protein